MFSSKLLFVANKLETLNIRWQRIQQGDEVASLDMYCVGLPLNRNTELKSLILSENKLYDETIQALSLALVKKTQDDTEPRTMRLPSDGSWCRRIGAIHATVGASRTAQDRWATLTEPLGLPR